MHCSDTNVFANGICFNSNAVITKTPKSRVISVVFVLIAFGASFLGDVEKMRLVQCTVEC